MGQGNWSEPGNAYIAEMPELPVCAADGRNPTEEPGHVERITAERIGTAQERDHFLWEGCMG